MDPVIEPTIPVSAPEVTPVLPASPNPAGNQPVVASKKSFPWLVILPLVLLIAGVSAVLLITANNPPTDNGVLVTPTVTTTVMPTVTGTLTPSGTATVSPTATTTPNQTTVAPTSPAQNLDLSNTWTSTAATNYETMVYTTDDWSEYTPEYNDKHTFALNYPRNWTATGQTLFNGVKIASINALVNLKPGQTCFDNLSQENSVGESGFYITFISKKSLTINGKPAVQRVTTWSESGFIQGDINNYSYCYQLSDTQALWVTFDFYPGNGTTAPEAMYEAILATARIL